MAQFLSDQQIADYRDCFNFYDKKHSGKIACKDLCSVMRSLGACPTLSEISKFLSALNKKTTDHLDFSQFLTIMHKQTSSENINDELYEALKLMDHDNSGMISAEELRHILMHTGEKLPAKDVEQMFRAANVKGKGKIKYRDFIAMVTMPIPDY